MQDENIVEKSLVKSLSLQQQLLDDFQDHRLVNSDLVFQRQKEINDLQLKISCHNTISCIVNWKQTTELYNIISQGKRELSMVNSKVSKLQADVTETKLESKRRGEQVDLLENELKRTRFVLWKAILLYRKELDQQKALIAEQGRDLKRLFHIGLQFKMIVNMAVLILSMLIVRKTMSNTVFRLISSRLTKKQALVRYGLESMAILVLYNQLKGRLHIPNVSRDNNWELTGFIFNHIFRR